MMTLSQARKRIHALGACTGEGSGGEWIDSLSRVSAARAWDRCERGDWLLWLAARTGVDRRIVVLAACDCSRLALVHVPAGEERPQIAIETAERWTRGEATIGEVHEAASDAAHAADAAVYASDAAAAAYAAAHAAAAADYTADAAYTAHAAHAADYTADAAAYASDAAAYAYTSTYAASAADARAHTWHQCADLVRARIGWSMVEAALTRRHLKTEGA
jgi:hypothetical protein